MKRYGPFILILLMFSACGTQSQSEANPTANQSEIAHSELLDPIDFQAKLKLITDHQLIDVRSPGEIEQGFIPQAQAIDFREKDFREKIGQLDKQKAVFLYCAGGTRSGKATNMMKEMGFQKLYDLNGGFGAWKKAGLEIETP